MRENPDRVDVVTNQLLEETENELCEIIGVSDSREQQQGGGEACQIVGVVSAGAGKYRVQLSLWKFAGQKRRNKYA